MFSALKAFFSAIASIFGYARDKQLMDAGAARAEAKAIKDANDAANRARAAADAVKLDPDSLRNDPLNRDGWGR